MKNPNNKSKGPNDWREGRRIRAWELHQEGWNQTRIAQALGVTQGAVSQWLRAAREGGGKEALGRRVAAGPTPKLTSSQLQELPLLLEKQAPHFGFVGEVWTGRRVAAVIERRFGVRYHPEYIPRLLRRIGWSLQKPIKRAIQRDEEAIQSWRETEWPTLKKSV